MSTPSTDDVLRDVRTEFGPRFVDARREAESEARLLLDERVGRMSRDEFIQLGGLFNRHEVGGVVKRNRFTPAFTGHSILRLTERMDDLNDSLRILWGPSESDALRLVGEVLQNRPLLHGAGSSLLSMLMYLRDPERFGLLLNATMGGLGVANASAQPYRARNGDDYARFNQDLLAWREQWNVAAQEHDAVLAAMLRADERQREHSAVGAVGAVGAGSDAAGGSALSSRSAAVASACHLAVETVDSWIAALNDGRLRQAFFDGPPGTGKTFVARRLADHLATSSTHVREVQFHPAYSYEDFMEGLRPEVDKESGGLVYAVRPGLFRNFCRDAENAPDETFVLLIDEMNRADLAAVFGELLLLLEYRGRPVPLPYSHRQFSVPSNVIVLGTMNTADRSLALVDFALRRRFHAFRLGPAPEVLRRWLVANDEPSDLAARVFDLIAERVGPDPAAPGHSYWMQRGDSAILERTWRFQVHPYLAELWFDQPDRLDELDRDVLLLLGEGS